MSRLRIVMLLYIVLLLTSCLAPSKDVKTETYSSFLKKMLLEFNKDDKDDKTSTSLFEKYEGIVVFNKGDGILFESFTPLNYQNAIISTTNNNNMLINQSMYITRDKKDLVFSFDGDHWVSFGEEEQIERKVFFDSRQSGNSFVIKYSMAFFPSKEFAAVKTKFDKEVISLDSGLVFHNEEESQINCNLDEVILYIPKNTTLNLNFSIDGNLLKSSAVRNQTKIEAVRDMYIYIKNKSVSLSFDKDKWTSNILGFDVSNTAHLQSVNNREIELMLDIKAVYDKDTVSLSLVELLTQGRP